jgi:hypothetical protein
MNVGDGLSIVTLEAALFGDGVPGVDDEVAIGIAQITLELLVAVFGHDQVLSMLVELGDLERAT